MLVAAASLIIATLGAPTPKTYAMRLNLHEGQTFKYKLLVERDKPAAKGEIISTFKIAKFDGKVLYMDAALTGMTIDGKDRTKDLLSMCGGQHATFPWTIYSRRTGTVTSMDMKPGKEDLYPFLQESGVYLASFTRQDVKPGDHWIGATTATGGCTGATFNLTDVKTVKGKQLAYFDVTKIMFLRRNDTQVGPMKMIVDLSTGLPTLVEYKVKDTTTGAISHFRQTPID